MTFYISNGVY